MMLPVLRHVVFCTTHLLSYMHQLQLHWDLRHLKHESCTEQSKNAKFLDTKSLLVSLNEAERDGKRRRSN